MSKLRHRHVAHLYRNGRRAVDELLHDIGAKHFCMTLSAKMLVQCSALDSNIVAAVNVRRHDVTRHRAALVAELAPGRGASCC